MAQGAKWGWTVHQIKKSINDRILSRLGPRYAMGGGGGSVGNNPASGNTSAFGQGIATTGTGLTDWFGQLKSEDTQATQQLNPFIDQMLNNAFDPQKALYGRNLQQLTDQTRSGEAARGVADTPYGAAAEGNALSNFNIDWENTQLLREQTGLGSAANTYSQLIGGGATAALPAEAALQGYTNAYSTSSQASTADLNRQQQANEFQQQQSNSLLGSLGQSAGSLGSSFASLGKGGSV